MGNKLNLFNLRHKRYKAMWYAPANSYKDQLITNYKVRQFIMDESRKMRLDISDVVIYGSSNMKIDLHTSKPGLVLGKSGANINAFKARIASIAGLDVENLNLNVIHVNKPELNAALIALKIAQDLERRRSYNQSMRTHAEDAMKFGAIGVRVECSGRLNGVEIARSACVSRGTVPRNTIRANVFYSAATAYTKCGTCGVKVWLNAGQKSRRKNQSQEIEIIKSGKKYEASATQELKQ